MGGTKIKALLIGCSYDGQQMHMEAGKHDVKAMTKFIEKNYHVPSSHVRILHEDAQESRHPTRRNILHALKWLVNDLDGVKHVFFYFAGHGGLGKNNVSHICPTDFKKADSITADTLCSELVGHLGKHQHLTAFFQHCHSGNSLEMPYLYTTPHHLERGQHKHHRSHFHRAGMPVVFCFGASNTKLTSHHDEKMSCATKAFIKNCKAGVTVLDVYRAIAGGEPTARPEFSTSLAPPELKIDIGTDIPFLVTHRHW
ncbi:caspase domain-containing protein [Mycena maculata]|uniref:Caspase domain-containing protein n=1 Tax=Mycena maculata TaxID=230809 RepID=A0AAD7MXD9_9AGAR|nr:caspase domain-containing protein [Mycena maculata]